MLDGLLHVSQYDVVPPEYDLTNPEQPPAVVVPMGGKLFVHLQALGLYPKNASLTAACAQPTQWGKGWIVPAFDPAILQKDATKISANRWAVIMAHRIHSTGSPNPQVGKYEWVEDLAGFIDTVKAKADKTGRAAPVAWDLETMGLWPWYEGKRIVSSQWCHTGPAREAPEAD
jgi:hypothetical protein